MGIMLKLTDLASPSGIGLLLITAVCFFPHSSLTAQTGEYITEDLQ